MQKMSNYTRTGERF